MCGIVRLLVHRKIFDTARTFDDLDRHFHRKRYPVEFDVLIICIDKTRGELADNTVKHLDPILRRRRVVLIYKTASLVRIALHRNAGKKMRIAVAL